MSDRREMLALTVLLALSVAGPGAAVRRRIPTAVMLILLGMGFGPMGLAIVEDTHTVAFLSEFGFLVLMFMAGMEIDFEAIRDAGRAALVVPSLVVVGIFVCAGAAGAIFGLDGVNVLVLGAMSVGMPLAVLKETNKAATPLGRHVMLTTSLGELVAILAITGLEVAKAHGPALTTVIDIGKVLVLLIASAVAIRWARALVWWHPRPFQRLIEHHDVAELGVRVGLVIMLCFVLMAAVAGVEPILGAFLGGSLIGFVLRQKHALEAKIAALGNGLFIPIFFLVVGLRFEASALDRDAVRAALMLAGLAAVAKILPSLIFAQRGTPLRERLAAGCLISAPLTLVVAIGGIARKLGMIDGRRHASFVLLAMVVSIVFPIVFRLLVRSSSPAPSAAGAGQSGAGAHGLPAPTSTSR